MNSFFNKSKEYKTNIILIFILLFSFIMILISVIYSFFNKSNNNDNLYNVGNVYDINNTISGNGIAVFDEFVIENFNNIEVKSDNKRVYRTDQIVDNTNNFDAYENATKIYNIIKDKKDLKKINDISNFEDVKNNIINNNYNILNISSVNNINNSYNYEKLMKFLDSYIKNKSVKLDSSGYVIDFYDGYESIYNIENLENSNLELLTKKSPNKSTKIPGLKYVNNKYYYLITYIKNAQNYNKDKLETAILKINKKDYNATIEKTIPYKEGIIIVYKLLDNIEEVINNRFVNYELEINKASAYRVPHSAVFKLNGIEGVYFVENNKVKFTPVNILKKDKEYSYISNNFRDIFPNIASSIYKNFSELYPFAKVILNPNNYKENDNFK